MKIYKLEKLNLQFLFIYSNTSLASHFVPLQASPVGLLGRFTHSGFALASSVASCSRKFSKKKKCVSIDSKCSETHTKWKKKYPFDSKRALRYADGKAQPYLPHVTPRVPRSVQAKFHDDWSKTVGAGGIHTDRQTDLLLLYRLAYRPAPRTFQLALRGYSVASLPRASRSHLARFAHARFALTKIFEKKKVCLNRLKMLWNA